ncbi:MAG TPA: hypothetical protein PKL17_09850 [Pseudomonadota bacterium]|nr:hypothetical protein [Pseudomonadota bacterium]HNK45076.1 hypothetical protein [Pseudomonadota bacterium]
MSRSTPAPRSIPSAENRTIAKSRRSLSHVANLVVRRWLVFGLGLWAMLFGLAGCMGPVAKASFAKRLGSGEAGNLLGPFDGLVIDQSTSNPLASALVVGTWAFQETGGLAVPESSYTVTAVTGSDGSYSLPSLPAGRQFAGLLRRFTLVVYKAGFVGYRSDLRFEDRSPRHNFVQRGNVVRLDRFPANESHVRHLVFLGSGAALRGAAQAEIIAASLELQDAAPKLAAEESAPSDTTAPKPATGDSAVKEGS